MSLFDAFDPKKDAAALSEFVAPIVQQSVAAAITALKDAEGTALDREAAIVDHVIDRLNTETIPALAKSIAEELLGLTIVRK
jgi:hypothetical protein